MENIGFLCEGKGWESDIGKGQVKGHWLFIRYVSIYLLHVSQKHAKNICSLWCENPDGMFGQSKVPGTYSTTIASK